MNILLVSQCSKRALTETRRILDQFAERKGECSWATSITQEGLVTLRKLLRQRARRNTAVACHWLKHNGQNELLWIVGNANRFNEQGTVPTNRTGSDILKQQDENRWHTGEVIALLAGIAGLFHDVGKANALFQQKLLPGSARCFEPYRHEWVSLWLFQVFVAERSDKEWLTDLSGLMPDHERALLAKLSRYQDPARNLGANPFIGLPPLARAVGWLIVSHHRLPQYCKLPDAAVQAPAIDKLALAEKGARLDASWNSPQCVTQEWNAADWQRVWQFPHGTPLASRTWCSKANQIAARALKCHGLWHADADWLQDRFTSHLARLSLMLADHAYSAGPALGKWQDPDYRAYANTERATGRRKQRLDEHNIGVGQNALLLAKCLPQLRRHLPAITRHKGFKQRATQDAWRWQDRAYDLARGVASLSARQGFFGVNMASTGCGKTFANARIMYGLADEKQGCRFSVALGLRTLTLQTGDALGQRLHLDSDELAVLIGSASVQQLHELRKEDELAVQQQATGSESAEVLLDENQHVRYEGTLDDGPLRRWLKQSDKVHQLISAPVLVSTIDHLIPATEGTRGGRQIAPMLRLLTSDLVLDEPDDFDLADLPALCRLVNWAGMLGSRVLLSSATLPPALVCALFDAYQTGREHYNRACGEPGTGSHICCAWFDEFGCEQQLVADRAAYKSGHGEFVSRRIRQLEQAPSTGLRQGELLPVSASSTKPKDVIQGMAEALHGGIAELHQRHHQCHESGKCVSIGLVRMANINPLVAVSQHLLTMQPPTDTRIHFCIYHSQHLMLVRSEMEKRLDKALTRHDKESLWRLPEVQAALSQRETHHIFLVLATAVAEVGRDHDYDWAIAEPSSMRSLIQLAGRIQRHRKQPPASPNLLILDQNYKALKGAPVAYCRPGFESDQYRLTSHRLDSILLPEQYRLISANPRIQQRSPLQPELNLVDLEHVHLASKLFGQYRAVREPHYAAQWWQHPADWSGELQRRSRFRESSPDESFVLYQEDEGDEPHFHRLTEQGQPIPIEGAEFVRESFSSAPGVEPWLDNEAAPLMQQLAERLERDIGWIGLRYSELKLRVRNDRDDVQKWRYHPLFGVYDTKQN